MTWMYVEIKGTSSCWITALPHDMISKLVRVYHDIVHFNSIGWTRLHTVFDIAVLESLITYFLLLLRCGELESCGRRQIWSVGHF